MTGPLHTGALHYYSAGWRGIIPWHTDTEGRKKPALSGVTGAAGTDLDTVEQLITRMTSHGHHQLGLRLPDHIIAIDVDHYADKHGADTITTLEQLHGPLPPTWTTTARGDGPSRQHLYRDPQHPGRRYRDPGPDVETLQHHHRFVACWPSTHPRTQQPYRWYTPDGQPAPDGIIPTPDQLTELPTAWAEALNEGPRTHRDPHPYTGDRYHNLPPETRTTYDAWATQQVTYVLDQVRALETGDDAWNKRLIDAALTLRTLARDGWSGYTETTLLNAYLDAVPDDHDYAERRWHDAAAQIGRPSGLGLIQPPDTLDLMALGRTGTITPHTAEQAAQHTPPPTQFQPTGQQTDSDLGDDVLRFHAHRIRYAADSGQWIRHDGRRWRLWPGEPADFRRALVRESGDALPTSDDPDEKERLTKLRGRMLNSGGQAAIGNGILAHLGSGDHPLAVQMAELDTDPHLLWCNGVPYDLRHSTQTPAIAGDMGHLIALRDTDVTPQPGPTPLFDALLAAIWPEPEHRAWAVRVLSVCLTGHPAKVLPILHGERDTGKTACVELLSDVLGDYAGPADARLLGSGDHHGSLFLALRGLRLAHIDEGPRRGFNATEKLKALTGGGSLTGNAMRRDPITFRPSHTLVMTTNQDPEVTDPALRSRYRPVLCAGDKQAVKAAREAVGDWDGPAWQAERPAVLARMMAEAAAWLADRSTDQPPAGVEAEVERMSREQDPVTSWLDQRTTPEGWTSSADLYQDFRNWYVDGGRRESNRPDINAWGQKLRNLGVGSRRDNSTRYRSLSLTPQR